MKEKGRIRTISEKTVLETERFNFQISSRSKIIPSVGAGENFACK
jgi:hypothetical protein